MATYEACRRVVASNVHDPKAVNALVNELVKLPEKMIQEFADLDWHIFITKSSIENHVGVRLPDIKNGDGFIGGITFWECRTIFVPIFDGEDKYFAIEFSTIHEFGHYFDRLKGYVSQSYEFQKIYNQDDREFCKYVGTASNTTSSDEFFAEAFAAYINNREDLKIHCIDTYSYMKKLFDKYI